MSYEVSLTTPLATEARPLSRAPQVASPSREGTPGRAVVAPTYFEEQHETWRHLCRMQAPVLSTRACEEYLTARERLDIDEDRIPSLVDLDRMLRLRTGWSLMRADGYIQPKWFFRLIAERCFPCMDGLRNAREILYTSEPDMFHDVMGHLPMLGSPIISEYYQLFGRVGKSARHPQQLACLDKVYWYSMEFGILNPGAGASTAANQARVFGAGLITAPTELLTSFSDAVERRVFSIDAVSAMHMNIHKPNGVLFEVRSLDILATQLMDWAKQEKLL